VTEECAQQLPNAAPTLQQRSWPDQDPLWTEPATTAAHREIAEAIELVKRIRALGHGHKIPAAPATGFASPSATAKAGASTSASAASSAASFRRRLSTATSAASIRPSWFRVVSTPRW